MIILDKTYIKKLLPKRERNCNKGSFGKTLIIASCRSMSGACILATRAALRSGSGLTYAASAESALLPLKVSTPEAITLPLCENTDGAISFKSADFLIEKANTMSAIVLGCGLSVCEDTKKLVAKLLSRINVPVVLDADGINILSQDINILKNTSAPLILTPHIKEFSRLIGLDVSYIKENKEQVASEFAKNHGVTLVLKDFETLIACKGGELYKNIGGHPCMAKGGSGDMLAGMLGALISQGLSAENAACAAVFLHSRAGEICGSKMGERSVITTDLIETLPEVFKEFE
ncbi:MAG: NAD(P)H-hydrate dehydratase [Oscillospiraceae bacterium]|nr:NAD(P)H-hydrate dehydratase [Oscillospiraceae bacterium]